MNAYIEKHYALQAEVKKKCKKISFICFLCVCCLSLIFFIDFLYAALVAHSFLRSFVDLLFVFLVPFFGIVAALTFFEKLAVQLKFSKIENIHTLVLPTFSVLESWKNCRRVHQSLKNNSVPSGHSSVLNVLSEIENVFESSMCKVLIPDYNTFRADHVFSYDSFGKDSKVQLNDLKSWFASVKPKLIDVETFSKLQKLYTSFYMRLDAYHRARIAFEELSEVEKNQSNFKKILNNELVALSKLSLNVDLIEEKEQTKTTNDIHSQNMTKAEYARNMFYFRESIPELLNI